MNSRGGLLVLSLVLIRGAVACSDTPLATPASDGNYDDEGAAGNMDDPGGTSEGGAAHDAARDSTPDTSADATPDVSVDAAIDAEPDVAVDGETDATPDAEPDAGD